MKRLNITAKIWLSVGVFILGYVLSTALGQIQSWEARNALRASADSLFPAAQRSQDAEAAFQRMVKAFGDAVITQDASGLERAGEDGNQAIAALKAVAAIQGLPGERSQEAAKLAATVSQLLTDAKTTYGAVMSGSLSASTQDDLRALAGRTDAAKVALTKSKEQAAADLHQQLTELSARSESQATVAMAVFFTTLIVAGVIVHLTIKRSITGPIVRVISGVQQAADESGRAATQVAESGGEVCANAQEQAACIEETSASLEEMSATTHQNADRAAEADSMMRTAQETVKRAAKAMTDLTDSMNLIAKSSHEVAGVLKQIDEIAFHTNILALNAAVEAARAGEAGAGFSVVADEVRSLAHRAAEAARNSGTIVEQTVADVAKGVELVGFASKAFEAVSSSMSSGTQLVAQIAASSGEQAIGITSIGQAIQKIESLTERNVRHAQTTADEATGMTTQVRETRKYLDQLVAVVGVDS